MFDQPMESGSIYYTEEEYNSLKSELGLTHADFLPHEGTGFAEDTYYGYMIGNDEDTIVYKNIQIVQNNINKGNLLKYFDAPVFEDKARTRLSITVKTIKTVEVEGENEVIKYTPLLPTGTSLLVTIDKNFYCLAGPYNKPVTMRESKKWPYFVNANTDNEPPVISGDIAFEVLDAGNHGVSDSGSDPTYMNSGKVVKFRFSITDLGSGPSQFFIMELKNGSGTYEKDIPIYYESVVGAYASCGNVNDEITEQNPRQYYSYVLSQDDMSADDDYYFKLRFFDVTGKSVQSDKTYYVSLDTKAPVVTARTVAACDDTTNTSKTAIQFDYTCDDFSNAKLYYRPAIATTAANWGDWSVNTNTTLVEFDKGADATGAQLIKGLEYGGTYEIKVDFYDKAKNVTSYVFKKRTKPEQYGAITPVLNEQSRCIKIPAGHFAQGADETVLLYKTNRMASYKTTSYTRNADGVFYIRNIDHACTYEIKIQSKNSESVTENCYENKGSQNENVLETVVTSAIDTRPLRFFSITNNKETIVGNQSTIQFEAYQSNLSYEGGVKYSYVKYNSDGTRPNTFTTGTIPLSITATKTSFELPPFEKNSHYYIKFEPYYKNSNDEEIYCTPENSTDFDFWTKKTTTTINPVLNFEQTRVTGNTITVTWKRSDPDDFNYYRITWKDTDSNQGLERETIIRDTGTKSFTITGLQKDTNYNIGIYCCTDDGDVSSGKTISSVKTKGEDASFVIPEMWQNSTPSADTLNTIKLSVLRENENGPNPTYKCIKYGKSYDNLNLKTTSLSELSGLTTDTTYYIRLYDYNNTLSDATDDVPISKMYAIRTPYKKTNKSSSGKVSYSYHCLSKFSYDIHPSEENNVSLSWQWKGGHPGDYNYIQYKKVGSDNEWTNAVSKSTASITCEFHLDPGYDYDIRFANNSAPDHVTTTYASGYISVPASTWTNFKPDYEPAATTSNSVKLKWDTDDSVIFDWYNVYDVTSGSPVLIADGIENTENPSITISGLTPNTSYRFNTCYHIVGKADEPSTANTNCREITTLQGTVKSSAVTNLKKQDSSIDVDTAAVSWSHPDTIYTYNYKVLYKKTSEAETQWREEQTTQNSFTFTGLSSGTEYQVKVYALCQEVNSNYGYEYSDPKSITFITKPYAATFNDPQITSTSITINWNNPEGLYSKVIISYSKKVGGKSCCLVQIPYSQSSKPTSYTLTDLEPNTEYLFGLYTYATSDENNRTACIIQENYKTLE